MLRVVDTGGSTSTNNVSVLDQDAFGSTNGTGRVHNAAKVIRLRGYGIDHISLSELPKLFKTKDFKMVIGCLEFIQVFRFHLMVVVIHHGFDTFDIFDRIA
jgi:seryl-tRNA(Sec) selenium transferase